MTRPPDCPPPDLVGTIEIAERLGVVVGTVRQWAYRDLLPDPDHIVSSHPVWEWETIRTWAAETGRLPATTQES